MTRYSICLIAAFAAVHVFAGEPVEDLQKASKLMQKRKYAEAVQLYGNVTRSGKDKEQLQTAQLYYAICLGRARRQQEAMKAAEQLKDPNLKAYAEMCILDANGKSADIVRQFSNAELNAWPEEYAYIGFYMRGKAFANTKQYDRALKDLKQAADLAGSDTEQLLLACMDGATAAHTVKQDDLALKITGKIITPEYSRYSNSYMFLRPMLLRAEILIQRKQFSEAEKALSLAPAKLGTKKGPWDCNYRLIQGDLALAKGDKAQAKKYYDQARICAGGMKHLVKECDKKSAALR